MKCCSDFDDECVDVKDPLTCWIGGDSVAKNGKLYFTPISDGYCPMLRKEVKELELVDSD